MNNISVAIATYNEEKNIEKCLLSVKSLADEIVIVDGSSTDRTVELASLFTDKIEVTTNPKNFHINKQKAIEKSTSEWILQLDADERVSKELAMEIKRAVKNSENNGFWISRKNYFLGKALMKGGQFPDYTVRLYRKGKGSLPQKDVHEQAVVEGKVGYLKNSLLHYPYDSFSAYLKKWNRYNDFIADQIRVELKNKSMLLKLLFALGYLLVRPSHWFLTTYFRHKGFYDSWQGFLFSLFSALRFPVAYIKYLKSTI